MSNENNAAVVTATNLTKGSKQVVTLKEPDPIVFDNFAYTFFEKDGQYHVAEIPFHNATMTMGAAKIKESNTDKFIVVERLHVLLLQNNLE